MRYFDEIAKKAQELSQKNGRAEGADLAVWLEAERIVMAQQQKKQKEDTKNNISAKFKHHALENASGLS